MACLNNLKLEIKTLESAFPKTHERFQVVSASVDELTCRFIGKLGKKSDIHANITVSNLFLVKLYNVNNLLCLRSGFVPKILFNLSYLCKETYPSTPPVWFADVEDPLITNAVQILSNTSGNENHVSMNF